MLLPTRFCWTRFGPEAGDSVTEILERKEQERRRNGGVFLWGIGNALGPSVRELVRLEEEPEVLFSPMRSPAKRIDVSPVCVVEWHTAECLSGLPFEIPAHSKVTSRFDFRGRKRKHYALVCMRDEPLTLNDDGVGLRFGELRNLRTGRKVGASQVTSVVEREPGGGLAKGPTYPVVFRAKLVFPYFVILSNPSTGAKREARYAEQPSTGALFDCWPRLPR